MKKLALLVVAFLIVGLANAQTTYTWIGASGGSWAVSTNWSPTRTTPATTDIIQFNSGTTLTITAVPTQTIRQLLVSGSTDVSLQAATTNTLSINGPTLTNNLSIAAGSTLQLGTGTGTLSLAMITTASQRGDISGTLTINTNSTFTSSGVATNLFTVASGGAITNNNGTVTATTGTLNFASGSFYNHARNGGAIPTPTWSAGSTCNITGITTTNPTGLGGAFSNLTWNNASQTSTGQITAALTINGNLNIAAGTLLSTTLAITGNATGTFTMGAGATLQLGSSTTAVAFPSNFTNANISLDPASTVRYGCTTAAQTISGVPTYGNLIISGTTSVKTLGAATTVNGNLTISNGTLATGIHQLTGNATGTFTMAAGTFLTIGSGATAVAFPTNFLPANVSLNATSTVTYSSTANQTIAPVNYGNLTSSAGPRTLSSTGTIGIFTTFTAGTVAYTSTGSTVSFNGTAAQTIPLLTGGYNNLDVNKPTGIAASLAGTATYTVTGDVTVTSGILSDIATVAVYLNMTSGGGAFTVADGAVYRTLKLSGNYWPLGYGSYNFNTDGGFEYGGAGAVSIPTSPTTYSTLIISGSGIKTLQTGTTVNSLYVNAGTLADGGNAITGSNILSVANGVFLTLGSTTVATIFPAGFTTTTLGATSTVTYNSNQAQTISSVPTYGNLATASTAAVTKTFDGNTTVLGTLSNAINNTMDLAGYTISVAGATALSNSGTFDASNTSSTLKLNGTATQTLTFGGTYTSNTLSNLEIANNVSQSTFPTTLAITNLLINATETYTLNAITVNVSDSYTNNGTLNGSNAAGGIQLVGTNSMTFTIGTYTSSVLGKLTINKTGGADVTLGAPLNVNGTLTLTSGILNCTSSNFVTVTATTAASVNLGGLTSFVNGPLVRSLPAGLVAGSTYSFPVGKSAYNLFELISPTTTLATTIRVEVFDAAAGGTDGIAFSSLPNPDKHWQATILTGALTASGTIRLGDAVNVPTATSVIGNSATVAGTYSPIGGANAGNFISSTSPAPVGLGFFKIGTEGCLGNNITTTTYTIGTTGADFTKITNAVAALNGALVCGNIIFELQPDYVGTSGETFPITINAANYTGGPWDVTFRPASTVAGNLTTSGTSTSQIFNFNGIDRFTFDGRPGGTGTAIRWVIANASATGQVIAFNNDATNNTLNYLQVEGVNTTVPGTGAYTNAGLIAFGNTAPALGNKFNTITNCNIKDGSTTPVCGIYSYGNTTAGQGNTDNTVTDCNIYNIWAAGTSTYGIFVASYNSAWKIRRNSIYQTATRASTASGNHYGINISAVTGSGIDFAITGNYIGGMAPLCAGTPWTKTGTVNTPFVGIYSNTLGTALDTITGNTVTNMSWFCGASSVTSAPGIFSGIYKALNGGAYINGNTIGAATGTGAITVTSSTTGPACYGIVHSTSTGTTTISNNTVGAVTVGGSTTALSNSFIAISVGQGLSSSSRIVSNNIINNIIGNTSSSTTAQFIRGIDVNGGANALTISNNTISNLTNNYSSTGATGQVIGINAVFGALTISGNEVFNLTTTSVNTGTGASASAIGIAVSNAVVSGHTVSNNKVYNVTNTAASANANVIGILANSSTTSVTTYDGNLIHSLSSNTTSTTSTVVGLYSLAGQNDVQNSMIRLGINAAGASITQAKLTYGIWDAAGNNDYYFNSVYIGGTGVASGTLNTFAFFSASTATRNIRNNIFWNARSNASGTGKHYALNVTSVTNLTCNYNDLYVTGTGGLVAAINTTDYATLAAAPASINGNSISSDPIFLNATGNASAVDLHVSTISTTPIEGIGINIATVSTDYDGEARASFTPEDLGADAGLFIPIDQTAPTITYSPFGGACNSIGAGTYNVANVTITDASDVNTSAGTKPRIYFKKSTDAGDLTGWKFVEANGTTSPFNFDIDFSLLNAGSVSAGDIIQYFVVAQDEGSFVVTPNVAINSGTFAANPSSVALTSAAFPIGGTINTFTVLPCQGTITVGSTSTYTSFTRSDGIFNSINQATLTGNIIINVESNITIEDGTVALNQWAESGVGNYTVTIQSSTPGVNRDIASAAGFAGGLFRINGADRVTFNGGTGSARDLTFRNPSTANTAATFVYLNDATNNTMNNCIIEGAGTSTTLGTLMFSTAAATGTGNDNNTITNCDIRDLTVGSGTPYNAVYALGTAARENSGNTISNCNIFNYYVSNAVSNGVLIAANNSGFTIDNNKFYQTVSRINHTSEHYAIQVTQALAGGTTTISNNTIGYASNTGTGIYTLTNASGNSRFNAIYVNAGTTSITGNTIQGITFTSNTGGANITPALFSGISLLAGNSTITGNTIGSTSSIAAGTKITIASNVGTVGMTYGIRSASTGTLNISNNNIGNISLSSSSTTNGVTFYGINTTAGVNTISGNTIGSATLANSIQITNTTGTNNGCSIQGIINSATSGAQPITNNIIANLTNNNNSGNSATVATGGVGGISVSGAGQYTITGNSIKNLSAATIYSAATGPAAFGIVSSSTNAATNISNNLITDITSSLTTGSTQAVGISASAGVNTISNNKITIIRNNTQNTTAVAASVGINMASTTAGQNISGNTIHSLITNSALSVRAYGINYAGPTSGTNTIAANTIHSFTANNTTSSNIQAGIYLASGTCTVANNVIRLGLKADNNPVDNSNLLVGIQDASTSVNNIYYNSVFITGASGVGIAGNSYAMYRSATPGATETVKNNIFANNRTGGSSISRHFAYASNTSGNIAMDNNIFQTNPAITTYYGFSIDGTNAVTGVTALHAIRASIAGQNLRSGIGTLAKINFMAATDDTASFSLMLNDINCAVGAGLGITGITNDAYGYTTRATGSAAPTTIGAHEASSFQPISTTDAANSTDIYTPLITTPTIPAQSAACGSSLTINTTATITDVGTGVDGTIMPTLWWRLSGGSWAASPALSNTGSTYNFSFNITGLTTGQTYEYYVAAQDNADTPNIWYSSFNSTTPVHADPSATGSPFGSGITSFATNTASPLSGTVYVGTGQTYTSFNAFDATGLFYNLNTYGISSDLIVEVTSDINENGLYNVLGKVSEYCGSNYTITIRPSAAAVRTISKSAGGNPLINMAGTQRITFDGNFGGAGRYLTFASRQSEPTFYLNGISASATEDIVIKNCTIEGNNTQSTASTTVGAGVINFASSLGTGMAIRDVTIDNNIIRNRSDLTQNVTNTPVSLIQIGQGNGTSSPLKSNITISNNELFNFQESAIQVRQNASFNGIGDSIIITGNKVYMPIAMPRYTYPIWLEGGSNSQYNVIANNIIGGNAAPSGSTPAGTWSNTLSDGEIVAIYTLNGGSSLTDGITISGNTIGNMTISGTGYTNLIGIRNESGYATITNNTITTITNSGGGDPLDLTANTANIGIWNQDDNEVLISGNTVTNWTTPGIVNRFLYMIGIQHGSNQYLNGFDYTNYPGGKATITNNILSNLYCGSGLQSVSISPDALIGIFSFPKNGSTGNLVSDNTISGLRATLTNAFNTRVYGIGVGLGGYGATCTGVATNNKVYDLNNAGGGTATEITGMVAAGGNWTFSNNMISITNSLYTTTPFVYGIQDWMTTGRTAAFHYNSVYLGGSPTGSNSSYAYVRVPDGLGNILGASVSIRNNIFLNNRTGGSTNNIAIGNLTQGTSANAASGWNSDYNLLFTRNTGQVGRWVGTTTGDRNFTDWKTTSSGDNNSITATYTSGASNFGSGTLNPTSLFTNVASDLHVLTTDGQSYQFVDALGAVVATTTDIDGETRNVTTPDIGADEFAACSITANTITAAQTICSGTAPALLDGSVPTTTPASPTYQWESSTTSATTGFSAISGATAEDYTPGALTQTTWFRRVVYASSCSNNSTAVQITVSPIPAANAGADQTICYSGGTITGASATNNNGFSWSTSGTGTFSPNNTTLAATYIPSAGDIGLGTVTLTLTATNSGCIDATDSKDVTIIMANNWIGSTSTDWFTASNWCLNGAIPTTTTNITIPSSLITDFDPLINGAGAVCGSIFINTNGVIGIAGNNNLDIHGDWNNSGTFDYNTSTVTFKGSTNTNIGGASSPHTFYNLTVNKGTSAASVTSTDNINVVNQTTITQGVFKIDATTVVDLGSLNTVILSNGTLHVNGGDATATGITSAGVVNPETGTLDVSNGIVFTGGAFNQSTATVTLSKGGANSNTAAVFTADGNTAINITGGSVIFQLANAGTAGDVSIASGAGTKTITGGTFRFGNAATTSGQVFKVDNNAVDFNNFTVDNSNATTPTVRLISNAAINSQGVLAVNSMLDLNQRLFLINNNSASAVTRTSPGYIMSESQNGSSRIVWNLGGTTGTNYTFPLGNSAGTYMPVTMNLNSGNIGFAGISSYKSTGATSGNWPLGSEAVTNVANPGQAVQRFWHLESSASPTTYNVDVTFSFDNTEDPTLGLSSVVKMQRYNKPTNSWDFALPGQVFANTTTRTVMVPGITKFSWWGGGNDASNNNPLPIELTNFKASCNGNEVRVNWTTATEINNDYFTVQRSTDLVTFDNIAVVEGAGNSNTARNYDAIDNNPVDGIAYYRLVQTDFNGQTETFSPVAVTCSSRPVDVVSVYPNPAQNELYVNVNLTGDDQGILVVYNHLGQQVFTRTINAGKGFNKYTLDVSGFAAGQYFVSINLGSRVLPVQKLVITR